MATAKIKVPLNSLDCPVCLDTVGDPKILPCGHSLCGPKSLNNCLFKLEETFHSIKCPSCQITHSVVQAADVPTNFSLREMLESYEPVKDAKLCTKHGKEIIAVCKTDAAQICMKCVKNHAGHDIRDIEEEAFEKFSLFWKNQSDKLDDMVKTYAQCKESIKDSISYLEESYLKINSLQTKLVQVIAKKDEISCKLVEHKFNPNDGDVLMLEEFLELKDNTDEVSQLGKLIATFFKEVDSAKSTELTVGNPLVSKIPQSTVLALGKFGGEKIVGGRGEKATNWNDENKKRDFGYGFQAVCHKNKLYMIGGETNDYIATTRSVYVLNVSENKWTQGPQLNTERAFMASCIHECSGSIFVFGGISSLDVSLETAERLVLNHKGDPSGQWEMISPMPMAMAHNAVSAIGDFLYVCGGENKDNYLDSVHIFIVSTGTWKSGRRMNQRRSRHSAVSVGNKIYVMGGTSEESGVTSALASCEVYDSTLDVWAPMSPLPVPRFGFGAALFKNHIYIVGGYGKGSWVNLVHIYDTKLKNWSKGPESMLVYGYTACVSW